MLSLCERIATEAVITDLHDMLLTLMVATVLAAQAAPLPPENDAGSTAVAAAAEQVARAAEQLRGDATIATTLQTVQVGKHDDAEQALAALGFATALDLRLLAGGPEAAELMAALRTGGGLGIADRAKIRLLVGRSHIGETVILLMLPLHRY